MIITYPKLSFQSKKLRCHKTCVKSLLGNDKTNLTTVHHTYAENEKYLTQEVVGATYNITEDNFKDKSKDE